MKCAFNDDAIEVDGESWWYCPVCNQRERVVYDKPPVRRCEVPGLGDLAKAWLTAIGLTEDRWEWVLGYGRPMIRWRLCGVHTVPYVAIGEPVRCGCSRRREWLNRLTVWSARRRAQESGPS